MHIKCVIVLGTLWKGEGGEPMGYREPRCGAWGFRINQRNLSVLLIFYTILKISMSVSSFPVPLIIEFNRFFLLIPVMVCKLKCTLVCTYISLYDGHESGSQNHCTGSNLTLRVGRKILACQFRHFHSPHPSTPIRVIYTHLLTQRHLNQKGLGL